MGSGRAVTGKGLTTSIALELTDLGILRWDPQRNCIAALFGDSFSFGWGQDWRAPVLACFDTDFNCVGVPVADGIATQPAKQLWEYGHNNPDYSTVLPCDFIRVGNVWHVAVMLTQGLGKETMTEFWHSPDLVDWTLTGFGFPHPGSDPCTTMLSFDQFGDDIYIVGTHGLRRDGPIKMWRTPAKGFPTAKWEPVNDGHPILDGRYGELCLRSVDGNAVLSFFDAANYRQTAVTIPHPDGNWGAGTRIDYVTGQQLPQLYGGYIAPNSRLNEPDGMKFWVSQWLTADNSQYHVLAYTATLDTEHTEQPRSMFRTVYGNTHSENGWPMVDEGGCEWVTVPNTDVKIQLASGQPAQILRAFMADWHAHIEPLRNADTAGWTATNSVATSNHLSGTAVDGNWDDHPFHVSNAGFTPEKIRAMRELLDFYTYDGQKIVWWGQDWGEQGIGPFDCMHVNLAPGTFKNEKTQDFIDCKIRPNGLSTFKRSEVTAVTEKVLTYDHSQQRVAQEKFWDCGPASTQIVLQAAGVDMSEDQLIRELGTNEGGTNTVEQALPVLNRVTKGRYAAVWMPNDPPSRDQRDMLWANIRNSIDAGYGCVLNFEVPSSNFPRGTRGSTSPSYRGSKIWHYVACMGYADDGPGGRHVWIADPGFQPFGYWMSLEQAATAIPPHAYAYATVKAKTETVVPPAKTPDAPITGGYSSRSAYRTPGEGAIGGLDAFTISDDAMLHILLVEWSAIMAGDLDSIYRILRSAAGRGADTSPGFVRRAKTVLRKIPRDDLAAALAEIEKTDPELLKAVMT